ncbi:calcium and integrin-binding protein 1 [Octopus bimaculoides]|uniref:EF-hand domain-containing protein n=1 Tax=Octopus bimaculoides TaxID=37653 RepID=A0A0L8G4Y2_OCTBM|nr:calcium and integrin-binding protein 1 [Octopus bimaculoides]|eukprot:XP_014784142.1 PREDICTED: calcium and integrin-binding protein 1-like [Octopus bimaculoides]
MGLTSSVLKQKDLDDYQQLTYFTEQEILEGFRIFKSLGKEEVKNYALKAKIPFARIQELPQLRMNPFRDRICSVFSSSDDEHMNFEDFLHMMSVFSDNAPKDLKAHYAFNIYDLDNDERISERDLFEVLDRLTVGKNMDEGNEYLLSIEEKRKVVQEIMKVGDLDRDNVLSFSEFCHIIDKAPDFLSSFIIHL